MEINIKNISFDKIFNHEIINQNLSLTVLRLDKIHEDVSGNKLFKLHYFLEECLASSHKTILTFGGAYSNHLVATAFLCNQKNIKSIGIVRGEEPQTLSPTLIRCKQFGMELKFVSRETYQRFDNDKQNFVELKMIYGEFTIVPEGGYHAKGAEGASLIMDIIKLINSFVCFA